MADYGATLCFDDAENIPDPKRTDPDKRTLLLAGNRKGNTVPVKEPVPGGGWRGRTSPSPCGLRRLALTDFTAAWRGFRRATRRSADS